MKNILAIACVAAAMSVSAGEPVWHDASELPLYGTLVPDAAEKYSRLPECLKDSVRDELWNLGLNSAGLSVRFASDSPELWVKWHSRNKFGMNHMTDTGVRGLDLYMLQPDSSWTFVNSGRPSRQSATSRSRLIQNMDSGVTREYCLFLSLYDGVDSLYIGTDSLSSLTAPVSALPERRRPVVMYGTSILQGGCATRPGMAHTNVLQRMLNREVINLGFSGNARLDIEIADLMASAEASLYIVDPLPNCTSGLVDERMDAFLDRIRAVRPDTPVMLVESPLFPIMRYDREVESTIRDKNRRLRAIYERRKADDPNLYYFEGERVFGPELECTVDNYHLTDAAFEGFAKRLYSEINLILMQ